MLLFDTGDTVGLTYSISSLDAASNGRYSYLSVGGIAVPKNGATTSFAMTARL